MSDEFTRSRAEEEARLREEELREEGLLPVPFQDWVALLEDALLPVWLERTGLPERFRPQRGTGRIGYRPLSVTWAYGWAVAALSAAPPLPLNLALRAAQRATEEFRAALVVTWRVHPNSARELIRREIAASSEA